MADWEVILFDGDEKYLAHLNADRFDSQEIEGLDGEYRLLFSYPLIEDDSSLISEGCLIAMPIPNKQDEWALYEVGDLSNDGDFLKAECNHDYYNLKFEDIVSWSTDAQTSDIPITATLANTRYQLGIVEVTRQLKRDITNKSPLESLRFIEKEWGGELRFRITITGSFVITRYVDHLSRRGSLIGTRFEFGHNLDSFDYSIQFSPVTAMYGFGQGPQDANGNQTVLTFADFEWKTANGDPVDKPLGQTYVVDPQALALYGFPDGHGGKRNRFSQYQSQAQTLEGLLWETWTKLQEQNSPLLNIEAKIRDLSVINPDFAHETATLGDDVFVIAENKNKPIEVEARIIRYVRKRLKPQENEVELGNYIPLLSDVNSDFQDFKTSIESKTSYWDSGGASNGPVTDDKIADILPNQVTGVVATGLFQTIVVEWNFDPSVTIAKYQVYASKIQGFTPQETDLVFEGKNDRFSFKGDVNEQWYFLVRAVNTHGNTGPFSEEATAQTATIQSMDIQMGAVTTEKLANLSVEAAKLAAGSVTFDKILDNAVGTQKLADWAVTGDKLAQGSVGADKIEAGAITEAKMNWNKHLLF